MSTISLEHQKQLGRQLGRSRQNVPGLSNPDENAENSGQMSSVGKASFIMLGGFALLKDIFDFVFVGMAFFKSGVVAAADKASLAADALALVLWAFPDISYSKAGAIVAKIVSWGAAGVSFVGGIFEAKTQAEGIILPFLFTTMFMIIVVAVLLLSDTGLKSYKIFLNARFIGTSFLGFFAEIIPGLNILPWTAIFVIFLYFFVKRELKKQQAQTQTA